MKRNSALVFTLVVLAACSGSKDIQVKTHIDVAPQTVNSQDVGSVLLTDAKAEEGCARELVAQGAGILYRNSRGLVLIDKKASEVKLEECTGSLTDNVEIQLEKGPRDVAPLADLPTLLKLIPSEEIGAQSFVSNNPTFDGRGVIVAILDTGVEVDHPMFTKTPTGENKFVDFEDFSGEGKVTLNPVTPDEAELVRAIPGSDFHMGVYRASTLSHSEDVASKDVFVDVQVISYKNAEGKRRLRIDTNADKKFEDEVELYNFGESQLFVKLGKNKTLTTSIQVSEDGKNATLCFDDGTHGTHVAGITAGYDPNGLKGVAPGARVLGAKIGDNRLSGGSTTTASMLLAIDYAVQKKAHIVNLSYGIRSGSNLGRSTIDAYVDKVALESGMIFSISAGNEGPGLLTIGTPAGANLAITNGAYVSKQTARDLYGYAAAEDDTIWYFSSVGPRLDGGLKPTLLAPGSALASVPKWHGLFANYRGTSMASPQTTGGLALLLSAAIQSNLPQDRVSVTRAVYDSAKNVPGLSVVEQGHGLFNVPAALKMLEKRKGELPLEYNVSVNSPTAPSGRGAGIYIRSRNLPENTFTVGVSPVFPKGTADDVKNQLKTFRLEASHEWIKPVSTLWMTSQARTFQVEVKNDVFAKPGLQSGKIKAISEATGEVAFVVPVTVVSPVVLNDANAHQIELNEVVKAGETKRIFLDVPAGTTAIQLELVSDGPVVWGQLLDPEGRKVSELRDTEATAPQPPLFAAANLTRAGVYEVDLVGPAYNKRRANVRFKAKVFSLVTTNSAPTTGKNFDLIVQNNFETLKFIPKIRVPHFARTQMVEVTGVSVQLPLDITTQEAQTYSAVKFQVLTSKRFYDQMTDYPFRVIGSQGDLVLAGGLELDSEIALTEFEKLTAGRNVLDVTGAFTSKAPDKWFFDLTERRVLKTSIPVSEGARVLLETGQEGIVPVNLDSVTATAPTGMKHCAVISLDSADGRKIQETEVCF